jgi:hypothetical protein
MERNSDERLAGDEWATQYGQVSTGFRRKPRWRVDRQGVSLIRGYLSPREATLIVQRREPRRSDDCVRHALISRLQDVGFVVKPAPTRTNPDHLRVEYPGEWDDDVGERFDGCFGQTLVEGQDG